MGSRSLGQTEIPPSSYTMLSRATVVLAIAATAEAFSPAPVMAPARAGGIRTAVCMSAAPSRRDLLAGLVALPLAAAAPANAFKYGEDTREAYLEQEEDSKKARWGRQPTLVDVGRNVKKIESVKATIDACEEAVAEGDAKGVADAIGDLTIEATKKNANLGKDIPQINKAKPYFFTYASLFSKQKESPLTKDLKAAATAFFESMDAARLAGLKDDLPGATAAVKEARSALKAYADAIEAETLGGRLNTVKVSVMGAL